MSTMLQSAAASICATPATMPGWSTPNTEITMRPEEPSWAGELVLVMDG
jgi:hypothetical protein